MHAIRQAAIAMTTHNDQQRGYTSINGLDISYEIHGSRQHRLLPGGYRTIEAMGEMVPQLAATQRVIAVEPQGHGHTADIERPLRFELMADDIAVLITHLGLERADLFGFSLGGGVGLQTAHKANPSTYAHSCRAQFMFCAACLLEHTRRKSVSPPAILTLHTPGLLACRFRCREW
jgi:pimeloyl-ACP methyl ester carboxylesterase